MQLLKDVAQQARFAAMQPGQFARHYQQQAADAQAFESAAFWAETARIHREAKRLGGGAFTPGQHEAKARAAESRVRNIALASEIILQRRAEAAQGDRAMLGILMGAVS